MDSEEAASAVDSVAGDSVEAEDSGGEAKAVDSVAGDSEAAEDSEAEDSEGGVVVREPSRR